MEAFQSRREKYTHQHSGHRLVARLFIRLVILVVALSSVYTNQPVNPLSPQVALANTPVTIYLTSTSTTSWVVPTDWNSGNNSIQVIGAGGGGRSGGAAAGAGGGGGGAFASSTNLALTAGATVTISVGGGGGAGSNGGDTYICNATSNCASIAGSAVVVGAKGGSGSAGLTGGAGGATTTSVGTTRFIGGTGGAGTTGSVFTGGGGGGAAGPGGVGRTGGAGDATTAGDDGGGGGGGAGGLSSTVGTDGGTSGGQGGTGPTGTAGGAGGVSGVGQPGSNGSGGGGGDNGQNGGQGGAGTEWGSYGSGGGGGGGGNAGVAGTQTGGQGGAYGGGGGGGEVGGAGGDGLIVITYVPLTPALTLSGILYTDEGTTPLTGSAKTIKVAVGTSTISTHSTTTNSGTGAWSITIPAGHSIVPNTPIIAFVDGDSVNANVFTKASSSVNHISNLHLYQNYFIISHEGTTGTSTTNTDLAFYDADEEAGDILYTATTSLLSVTSGTQLYVWPNDVFAPGGAVRINGNAGSGLDGSFHLAATSTYTAAGNTTIGGNFTASSSATFTPGAHTLVFNATTTGKIINTPFTTYGDLFFNGSGGAWSFAQANATTSNLTIGAGTLTAPSGALSITGNYNNLGTFTVGSGTTTFSGASTQTATGTMTGTSAFNNLLFTGSGTKTFGANASSSNFTISSGATVVAPAQLALSGNYTNNGTFTAGTGTTTFSGAITQTATGTMTGTSAFNNLLFTGSGTKTFGANASSSNFTIASGATVVAPNVLSITNGHYNNNGNFNAGSGIVDFSGTSTASGVMTGTSAFNSISIGMGIEAGGDVLSTSSFAGTATNTGSYLPWGIPELATGQPNSSFSTVSVNNESSDYLTLTNYNFSIPLSDSIVGIQADALLLGDAAIAGETPVLVKANGLGNGPTNPPLNSFPITEELVIFGSSTDLWGDIWRPADINDSGFGFAIGAFSDFALLDGNVDAVEITVYYQEGVSTPSHLTFLDNASTTHLSINASTTFVAPAGLTVAGDFTNNGTFTAGSGTTTFSGTSAQIATGTMTGTSAFANVVTTGAGTKTFGAPASTTNLTIGTTATNTFSGALSVSGNLTVTTPSAKLTLPASATTTVSGTTTITGTSGNEVRLRSTIPDTRFGFYTNTYTITFADIKDSSGSSSAGSIVVTNSIDSGNNVGWTFGGAESGDTFTLSGVLYESDRTTPVATSQNLILAVATSTVSTHSTTTQATTGAFSFRITIGDIATGTPLTVFVDGNAALKAVTVTKQATTTATTITNLPLYRNHVIIRNEGGSGTTTTIADLARFDSDDDSDIPFTATTTAGTSLTVSSPVALFVATSSTFAPGGAVTVRGNASTTPTDGSLHLAPSATYVAGGNTTLAGSFTASSSAVFTPNSHTLTMNATTTGKILNTPFSTYGNLTLNGNGGGWSFAQASATTTNFQLYGGTITAPSNTLTVQGNYATYGTFLANNGTVRIASTTSQLIEVNNTASSTFNNLTLAESGVKTVEGFFMAAYDTSEFYIHSLTIDAVNGTLYAGSGFGGIIYRCALSTGCDSASDFTVAYDTSQSYIYSFTIDAVNGTLYAGSGNGGIIYRCALSTGCDEAGDFTIAYDTSESSIQSLAIDTTNGTLYAGSGNSGIIYRCVLSTGCDEAGDFTVAYDTSESTIYSLTIDAVNGTLYAGSGNGGTIYRCALSTGCDASGDFTTAYDTPETYIFSLTIDAVNGTLYAGSDSGGIIYRCALSTGCDASGDFTVAYDTSESQIYSLTIDAVNGTLYAGSGNGGTIYRCVLSMGCDASGDFTVAYDTSDLNIVSLVTDAVNGVLYAGSSDRGIIYRCVLSTGCVRSTTTLIATNLNTLSSSTLVAAASTTLTGDFTQNGTTTWASNATLRLSGTNQTIAGTLTGNSALPNVTIAGSGTKTFSNNASTTALTINIGTTLVAPSVLSVASNFTQNGTYDDNGGTLSLSGWGYVATGTLTGTSDLGSLLLNGGEGGVNFTTTYDTSELNIYSLAIDAVNRTLYAGSASGGIIYRCALSTGCDASGDFTVAYDTPESYIYSLVIDAANGTLYAGSGFGGIIYRCVLSTGCDASGDFTVAYDTTQTTIHSLAIDAVNGTLYAGSANGGIIYRCALSTGCDASGDFTVAYDTPESYIYSLVIDAANGTLYAGSGFGGIIYRCALSTGCDASGDFTVAYDTFESHVYSLTIDNVRGVLYAGTGTTIRVFKCVLSTGCDASGDFSETLYNSFSSSVNSFAIDASSGFLYAGLVNPGGVVRCDLSTDCGYFTGSGIQDGFYVIPYLDKSSVQSLVFDELSGVLYAGSSGPGNNDGIIYRLQAGITLGAPASTTNLTIDGGHRLFAPTALSIAGNYTNNGTFTAGTGTTTFSGTSAQTATGTMTGTSAFNNLAFSGAGTKTLGTNASTTNFTVQTGSGEVVTPSALTVAGNYANNSTTTHAGAQWVTQSVAGNNDSWSSVTYGNGRFVAVSSSGDRVMYSDDGITWATTSAAGNNDTWKAVTYGNGLFVAVSSSLFNDHVMYSTDGITWATTFAAGDNDRWNSVAYGNGRFVAVAYDGDRVMYSDDGITWATTSAAGNNDTWNGVTYGNGLFVAVGSSGDRVMTSPDGITWTVRSAAGNNDPWTSVTYGNGLFVAVSCGQQDICDSSVNDRVMTSPDGINWNVRSAAGNNDSWFSVTYGNGFFVAVSLDGDRVMTSPDGITWTARSAAGDDDSWSSVTYGNGRFVAVSSSGDRVMTADDTTLFLTGSSTTVAGNLTGASQLRDVRISGGVTFSNNASTTNFTVATSSASTTLPSLLSIAGNYQNNGTVRAGNGTVYLTGSLEQTATGTMTGTSSFNNLVIANTNTSTSTTFGASLIASSSIVSTIAGGKIVFAANTTATTTSLTLQGSTTAPIYLRSTISGIQARLSATSSYTVAYVDVMDSNACGSVGGGITSLTATNSGNNTCWTFAAGGGDTVTVSGILYQADRLTPQVSTATVTLAIATTSNAFVTYSTTTVPTTGVFTFTLTIGTSTPAGTLMTAYVDNNATIKAVTVTKTATTTASTTNLPLYQNYTTLKSESTSTTTRLTDLYVFASSTDPDLLFNASSTLGRFTVSGTSTVLVASGTTAHLDLPLYAHSFEIATTATALASSSLLLTGNYYNAGALRAPADTSWTPVSAAGNNDSWTSITYGNGRFVAVGTAGDRVMHSTDGLTWATTSAASNDDVWSSVTYGNGRFVVVGSGPDYVMYSSDGLTWSTTSAAGNNDYWTSVTYGNSRFVAVGFLGDRVMYSTDGLTWATTSAASNDDVWSSVTYGNGRFVAVGQSGDRVMHSQDGITWATTSAAGNNDSWSSITYGNGRFVAVGNSGDHRVMYSDDGLTWVITSAAGNNDSWRAVTYGNGRFVAVGGGADLVMYSDGVSLGLSGTTTQTVSGSLTGANTLPSVIMGGAGTKTFSANASTSDLTVLGTSGEVTLPTSLTLTGSYNNEATVNAPTNLFLTGTDQVLTGSWTGAPNLIASAGVKTFNSNASTSNFTVASNTLVNLPSVLGLTGSYQNNGTTTHSADVWTARSAAGDNDFWQSVTYGNGLFVAVGGSSGDRVMHSTDGLTWATTSAASNNNTWRSVTYGAGRFVAVSDGGDRVMHSTDGLTWATTTAAGNNDSWSSITYGNGRFVAVGSSGDRVMYSTNGLTWATSSAAGNDDSWTSITYGNGRFVSVASCVLGIRDCVMYSQDGLTWATTSAAGNDNNWQSVTYGNGRFVAVGDSGDYRVMYSTDGITWVTTSVAGNDDNWYGVTYGNGRFVAVGSSGDSRVMYSDDGLTWVITSAAGNNDSWRAVTYGNGRFVAVGASGGDRVMTSDVTTLNLSSASAQSISGSLTGASALGNVVFSGAGTKTFASSSASTTNFTVQTGSGEVIVPSALTVAGNYTNQSITTMAGAQWVARSAASNNDNWYSITYGNGRFVAVGTAGDRVMHSQDGITWATTSAAGNNDSWRSVTYGNGRFVAVGDSGDRVMHSQDGITWATTSAAGNNDSWRSVTYGNGRFVSVGTGPDVVMTSPDGIVWTAHSAAGNNDTWYGVTYGNGRFVAVGNISDDIVMTSEDGINWTARTVGNSAIWQAVTYGNGLFVAVSSSGERVMTSPDGIAWTERIVVLGNNDLWRSVTYGNGLFVAVSSSGDRVMTSANGIAWTARSAAGDDDQWYSVGYGNGRFVAVGLGDGGSGGDRVMTADDTTLWFTGTNAVATGTLTGASQLRDVRITDSLTFGANASTTNFTVATTSSSTTLPALLSIAGNYQNNGTVNANNGTVYLSGSQPQTLAGTMTATSSFKNLVIQNNSQIGTTTFDAALTTDTLTAQPGTYIAFKSGATTTVGTLTLSGSSTAPIRMSATATTSVSNFVLTGLAAVSYTTISYSNACGSTGGAINVSASNNTDGGNTTCWNFTEPVSGSSTVALAESYVFSYQGATTTLGTITITDAETSTITTTNDIRLTIATSTTNFRFDTSITTPTFGGTAAGKVSGTVSYEDSGATLRIDVTENFSASNTLTISGIAVGSFGSVSTTTSQLELHTDGTSAGTPADTSTETFRIVGTVTVANHSAGQATNQFSWQNRDDVTLFAFALAPNGESATTTDLVITLRGVTEFDSSDLTNLALYRDTDSDGVLDGGDILVDSNGILTLNGQYGAITFSTDFLATTTTNYIIVGDTTTIMPNGSVVFTLPATGLTMTGVTSGFQPNVTATVSTIQHIRNVGGGGSNERIGGQAPQGGSTETGGGSGGGGGVGQGSDGENIASDPDFRAPTETGTPHNEWTNGSNALVSDGSYATASSSNLRQSFYNFGFGIPTGNTITGIAVKVDASGTTANGTIDVALSWDNGGSYTTGKATPTLSGSDIIYTVGGAADTWGRTWSAAEFNNGSFILRITAQPTSNTLRLDALEVRVFNQSTGGGSGGGGRI